MGTNLGTATVPKPLTSGNAHAHLMWNIGSVDLLTCAVLVDDPL